MSQQFWFLTAPNASPRAEWDHDKMELEAARLGGGGKWLTDLNVVLSGGTSAGPIPVTAHLDWMFSHFGI
jgi:hypothetical protein